MSIEIEMIEDVREMLRKSHDMGGDTLQRLWAKHRDGDPERPDQRGTMEKHFGAEYVKSTPEKIGEHNLTLTFDKFSTGQLKEIFREITHRPDYPDCLTAPVVIVKFGDNFHGIDGARRLRYWHTNNEDGPHKACVLVIND